MHVLKWFVNWHIALLLLYVLQRDLEEARCKAGKATWIYRVLPPSAETRYEFLLVEWIHWLKVPSLQSQNSVTGFMSLSLATLISIHILSQIIGGGDCGLSAYLFRAGSVSFPLLIQILNPIVAFWCYHITNAVLRMVMIPSSPGLNEQCENKWMSHNQECCYLQSMIVGCCRWIPMDESVFMPRWTWFFILHRGAGLLSLVTYRSLQISLTA